jgi:signal transduction histidine kinase
MKAYFKMIAVVAIFFFIGIFLLVILTNSGSFDRLSNSKGEVSALNDIAKTAELNKSNLSVLDGKAYNMDFVIVDMTENILFSHTSVDISEQRFSPEMAIQNRYPYIYLKDGDKIWGCLIELDDGLNVYRKTRNSLIIGVSIFSALIILVMISYGLYINRNIVIPFKRMKEFARNVAQGNLDEPIQMDKGNMFGAFSESFDIMREELSASKKRELELQKKERELVASLSHDLKTPVTGIKLAAELIQMRLAVKMGNDAVLADNDKQEQIINTDIKNKTENTIGGISVDEIKLLASDADGIRQKAEQIDVLVSDLFTSTLDDLGEFKVNCQDESSDVLINIVKNYDDRSLVAMNDVPKVIINIDKNRMAQAVGNIISNSYKYADTKIDISYRLSEGYLEMEIKDHGPGVPSEELDLITNKFYRGKYWQETDKEGNGLGLYIAKTLMLKMNGDLVAESDGDGLSVTLIIPLS